ncbi:MAG: hypothetical protein C0410_10665 [Anaerolinea sp.]|nr:hypothetical protein [Anaerolinea sp.]
MLNITGPIQSNLPPLQERTDQFLKVNQRISGEVLSVSNDNVILAVNGVQIVAKMTSADQLALLLERKYANFVVKDISNNQITLQIAAPAPNTNGQKSVINNSIGTALLEQLGLPEDEANLTIVQAALNRGLKITPELVKEMRLVLDATPGWSQSDAQLALALKSAGLPLTEASLNLAQTAIKDVKTNFLTLISQMNEALNRPGLPPEIQQMIRSIQTELQKTLIQSGGSKEVIEQNILTSIKNLGSSIENVLVKLLNQSGKNPQSENINGILFNLASLRHEIANTNLGRLSLSIDRFIEGMRWTHFINTETEQPVAKGQWTQMDLPISFGFNPLNRVQQDSVHNLQIRIAHENDEESGSRINPDYTRLVIQVDLDEYDMIKVDLSIVSHLIGAEVTATNKEICEKASEELDDFKIGLQNLGYTLKTTKVELGSSILEMDLNESGRSLPTISSVDLGV